MSPRRTLALGVCLIVVGTAGCQPGSSIDPDSGGDVLRVTRVADGDTISGLDQTGQKVRVRLLGIDAPEMAHGGKAAECGAGEARDSLSALVLHQDVQLVADPKADAADRYGRRLAYVEVRGADASRYQVETGNAEAWYPRGEPKPDRYTSYQQAQKAAQQSSAGGWAHCPSLGR